MIDNPRRQAQKVMFCHFAEDLAMLLEVEEQ